MGGLMSGVENSVNSSINDIINFTNNVLLNDIHELNKDYYEGYQWIACLDGNTCLACAELDNKIFDRLPGMSGNGTEPPDEPPLHRNCRCIIVPVLQGMKDEISQTKINYKDWFDQQSRAVKLDIIGPSRYKEYFFNGKSINSFASDGRIISLKELKIDRLTRQKLFEKIVNETDRYRNYDKDEINKLYNDELSAEQMQNIFKYRYKYIDIDVAGKMPKKQLQLLLKEYDLLLQQYPVDERLMKIGIDNSMRALGIYNVDDREIYFQKKFIYKDIIEYIKNRHDGYFSTDKENHVYLHEFAHAIDRAINQDGKIGRQLLLEAAYERKPNFSLDTAWKYFARKLSEYATKIPDDTTNDMFGGEFFAEAFTAYRNNMINNKELEWLIDFFDKLYL